MSLACDQHRVTDSAERSISCTEDAQVNDLSCSLICMPYAMYVMWGNSHTYAIDIMTKLQPQAVTNRLTCNKHTYTALEAQIVAPICSTYTRPHHHSCVWHGAFECHILIAQIHNVWVLHTYTHTHTYIHTYTHTLTLTHTYTHTHIIALICSILPIQVRVGCKRTCWQSSVDVTTTRASWELVHSNSELCPLCTSLEKVAKWQSSEWQIDHRVPAWYRCKSHGSGALLHYVITAKKYMDTSDTLPWPSRRLPKEGSQMLDDVSPKNGCCPTCHVAAPPSLMQMSLGHLQRWCRTIDVD